MKKGFKKNNNNNLKRTRKAVNSHRQVYKKHECWVWRYAFCRTNGALTPASELGHSSTNHRAPQSTCQQPAIHVQVWSWWTTHTDTHTQLPAWASHGSVWLLRRVINREARVWPVILGFAVVCYLGMKVVSPSLFLCFVWAGGCQQAPEGKKRDIWSNWLPVQSVTVFHSRLINNYTRCEWQPLTQLQRVWIVFFFLPQQHLKNAMVPLVDGFYTLQERLLSREDRDINEVQKVGSDRQTDSSTLLWPRSYLFRFVFHQFVNRPQPAGVAHRKAQHMSLPVTNESRCEHITTVKDIKSCCFLFFFLF